MIVVRWGPSPGKGVFMYPKNVPTEGGWAVVDGGHRPLTAAEAAKLFEKP